MEQLSNPHEGIKTLISQRSVADVQARSASQNAVKVTLNSVTSTHSKERGQLPNFSAQPTELIERSRPIYARRDQYN